LPEVAIDSTNAIVTKLVNPFENAGSELSDAVSKGFASGFESGSVSKALGGILGEAEQRALDRQAKDKAAQDKMLAAQNALGTAGQRNAALDAADKGGKKTDRAALLQRELQLLDEEAQKLQLVGDARDVLSAKMAMEEKIRSALRQGNKDLTEEQINNLARLTDAESKTLEAAVRRNLELQREADIFDEINGPALEYQQNLAAINKLLEQGKISTGDYNKKLIEFKLQALQNSTDISSGVERGLLSMQQQYSDLASTAEGVVTNAFQGMEDAIVEFATTGKLSFSDLIDSMVADITRLAVQQAIMKPLTEALSGIGGSSSGGGGDSGGGSWISSALSGLGSLLGFADGGSMVIGGTPGVDRNVLSINDKPVARVSRGETLAVTPQGSGSGGNVTMQFNISTPDANSFQRSQGQILARANAQMSRAQRRNG
jgi:lambda family phage tail tape measure protein